MTTSTSYTHSSSAVVSTTIGFAKEDDEPLCRSKCLSRTTEDDESSDAIVVKIVFFPEEEEVLHVHALRRSAEEKDKFARTRSTIWSKRKLGPGRLHRVEVTFLGANGSSVTVDCPTDQYILDAALDAGLNRLLPAEAGSAGRRARPSSSLSFRISLHSSILKRVKSSSIC